MYVLKFRGAGQGIKSLVAEFIGGEVARMLGLKVPELVFAELDEAFGRTEPDEEIQDLLKASRGLNIALHYLSGAIMYDPAITGIDALTASKVVWLDAFLANMDRTAKNTNMLLWYKELWLIDHGASLYYHHNWISFPAQATNSFPMIKEHVLLPQATQLKEADAFARDILTEDKLKNITVTIPAGWLQEYDDEHAETVREKYTTFLTERLKNSFHFLNPLING